MSHISNKALKALALSALLSSFMMPVTANAGVVASQGRNVVYKATFNEVEGRDSMLLDWRNPSAEFSFNKEDADWTDGLQLFLSADPVGRVSSRTPIMVQFNNDKPVPIVTRGQGFDTRIKLNPGKIRPRRNTVKITYKTPSGAQCLEPQHGAWSLNFKESFIVIKARAKSRNYRLSEIEARLSNSTTAPKSISILARGQNTTKLQALAAQGVGLRMKNIPDFRTNSRSSEFEIVLGRRDELHGHVTDRDILDGTGPRISVHDGRPMRLVITGDTDDEVTAMASAFATRPLPPTRRAETSLSEMQFLSPFDANKTTIDKMAKISDLGGTYFEDGWGPQAKQIKFNIADPKSSQGEILLRLASNKNVDDDSRVSVNLNGHSLGYTKLDKARKSVAFDIPMGSLHGSGNLLTITPELSTKKSSGCSFQQKLPGFYLGQGSRIKIETPQTSPIAELSKLTASGAPFSIEHGKDTVIALPSRSSRDYGASLKVLAKLAKSSGRGWTEANYMRSSNYASIAPNKNILFIGPSSALTSRLRQTAPQGLTSALRGKPLNGTNQIIASIERFASNNEADTMRLYAARQTQTSRIGQGGVAALYPSPLGKGQVMGVITNVPGRSFSNVANDVIKPDNWNRLEGSVSRWNRSNVLMAQTAMSVPGFVNPKPKAIGLSDIAPNFTWPSIDLPHADWTQFEFDGFDIQTVKSKLEGFRTRMLALIEARNLGGDVPKPKPIQSATLTAPDYAYVPAQKMIKKVTIGQASNTLELRGYSTVQDKSQNVIKVIEGTQIWVKDKSEKLRKSWQRFDLKMKVNALQSKLRPSSQIGQGSVSNNNTPSINATKDDERNLSSETLMLIFLFSIIFAILGLTRPSPRADEQH